MRARNTWLWTCLALALLAFIALYQRRSHHLSTEPKKILGSLDISKVTSVQVRPGGSGSLVIRADRTNNAWQLTSPIAYPAQAISIEGMLSFLNRLPPAAYIPPAEVRRHPKAEEEYGLAAPQAALSLQQGNHPTQVLIGTNTAPGDMVYLQVDSDLGIYVVSAELLKYVPRSANEWRDTTLVNLDHLPFDRLAVTNNSKPSVVFVMQRDPTNRLWRMVEPQHPRADGARIADCLQKLQNLRIQQFVLDDPKPDLEALGLAPPRLELAVAQGTNNVALLQFGKSVTNNADQVYARRVGRNSIFTVATNLLAPWFASLNDFRDPRLVTPTESIEVVEVRAGDTFLLRHQTNSLWQVATEGGTTFPADVPLVTNLLWTLTNMPIREFVSDVVNQPDLPVYGLAPPLRQYSLFKASSAASGPTNTLIAQINFGLGTNKDYIYAQRTDEGSVYAVSTNEIERLPATGYQMRDRSIWRFSETNVVRLTVRQRGKVRELLRKPDGEWTQTNGSPRVIEEGGLPITALMADLGQYRVGFWVAYGEQNRARYGCDTNNCQLTIELKTSEKITIDFGAEAPSGANYAAVTLDGQPWIFELPPKLYRDIAYYVAIREDR